MNQTKTCCRCKKELDVSCFHKSKDSEDGLKAACKFCRKEERRLFHIANREKENSKNKQYAEENKESVKLQQKRWREENVEYISEKSKKYFEKNRKAIILKQKNYRQSNKAKLAAKAAKERAERLKATPKWLNKEDFDLIAEFYEICLAFRLFTGLTYHVDHIVPIKGKLVCGLHVPWNLQILEASENIRKNNKFEIE